MSVKQSLQSMIAIARSAARGSITSIKSEADPLPQYSTDSEAAVTLSKINAAVAAGSVAEKSTFQASVSGGSNAALAAQLDPLIVGVIARDSSGAATSASVSWPDGATGVYTATTVSTAFPGAVDAYAITHVLGGVSQTYTQPAVTRDSSGAVINRPAITVA